MAESSKVDLGDGMVLISNEDYVQLRTMAQQIADLELEKIRLLEKISFLEDSLECAWEHVDILRDESSGG